VRTKLEIRTENAAGLQSLAYGGTERFQCASSRGWLLPQATDYRTRQNVCVGRRCCRRHPLELPRSPRQMLPGHGLGCPPCMRDTVTEDIVAAEDTVAALRLGQEKRCRHSVSGLYS
jgi:hypothetical protein